jgi:hypothetical protein
MRTLAATLFALVAGAAAAADRPDPTFHARLDRGMCLGSCPVYTVEIDADGAVAFAGYPSQHGPGVPCQGLRRWRASPEAMVQLKSTIDRSGVFSLKSAYEARVTDMSAFIVSVTRHGRTKTIKDYAGQLVGMPKAVTEIENAIDVAADTRACVAGTGKH